MCCFTLTARVGVSGWIPDETRALPTDGDCTSSNMLDSEHDNILSSAAAALSSSDASDTIVPDQCEVKGCVFFNRSLSYRFY